MFMFIKMSSKWYCKEVESLFSENPNIEAHVGNGTMVVLMDDIESFCDEMDVEKDEIEMVDN